VCAKTNTDPEQTGTYIKTYSDSNKLLCSVDFTIKENNIKMKHEQNRKLKDKRSDR
jgi:hypothetical protein